MVTIKVPCRFCKKTHPVSKHAMGITGHQRYRYIECSKTFQLEYAYKACKPGIKDQVIDMAMNSSGLHDTARVLKIGYIHK
jgi:transposase-like protein